LGHSSRIAKVCTTPDGKRVISINGNDILRIWDLETGECLSILKRIGGVISVSPIRPDGYCVLHTHSGKLIVVKLHNLPLEPPLVQALRLWEFHKIFSTLSEKEIERRINEISERRILSREWKKPQPEREGHWADKISTWCEWCKQYFIVPLSVLDAIDSINRNAGISADQSACLELPKEAWNDPCLLSECPHCHMPLKFNPFIVDNRERY